MKRNKRSRIVIAALTSFALIASLALVGEPALAQKKSDDTYGKGGTKETTGPQTKDNGTTVTKEVLKDPDGNVRLEKTVEKDKDGNTVTTEISKNQGKGQDGSSKEKTTEKKNDGSTVTKEVEKDPHGTERSEKTVEKDKDGNTVTTRELEKDKDGSPTHASEKDSKGNEYDIRWTKNGDGSVTVRLELKDGTSWRVECPGEIGEVQVVLPGGTKSGWRPSGDAEVILEIYLKRFGLKVCPEIVHLMMPPEPAPKPKEKETKQEVPMQSGQAAAQPPAKKEEKTKQEVPMQSGQATGQLVGLVYARDSQPDDTVSVRLVTNPEDFENTPALAVIKMTVPVLASGSLEGLVMDLGDGHPQDARQPCTVQIPKGASSIPVSISRGDNPPAAPNRTNPQPVSTSIPIGFPPAVPHTYTITPTPRPGDYQTQPVWVKGVQVIRGPNLSGNGNITRVLIDNQPATIVAETPHAVYFNADIAGPHLCTFTDGPLTAQFSVVGAALELKTDRPLELNRGESANFSAEVKLPSLPEAVWSNHGVPSDLVSVPNLTRLGIPIHGESGVIWLRIENMSRETGSISPAKNEVALRRLDQNVFKTTQGPQYRGVFHARKTGRIQIDAVVQCLFAPISGEPVRGGEK